MLATAGSTARRFNADGTWVCGTYSLTNLNFDDEHRCLQLEAKRIERTSTRLNF